MTAFLEELINNLRDVRLEGVHGPPGKVGDKDHVVGVMSDGLRRLWVLFERAIEYFKSARTAVAHAMVDAISSPNPPKEPPPELVKKINLAESREEALRGLFWESVRHEFPDLYGKESIGVREGWQVVWTEPAGDEASPPGAVFGGLVAGLPFPPPER